MQSKPSSKVEGQSVPLRDELHQDVHAYDSTRRELVRLPDIGERVPARHGAQGRAPALIARPQLSCDARERILGEDVRGPALLERHPHALGQHRVEVQEVLGDSDALLDFGGEGLVHALVARRHQQVDMLGTLSATFIWVHGPPERPWVLQCPVRDAPPQCTDKAKERAQRQLQQVVAPATEAVQVPELMVEVQELREEVLHGLGSRVVVLQEHRD